MLTIDNLHKTYSGANGDVHALNGISCTLNAGEFISIQGPSGCGKSTMLLSCGGLMAPQSGNVIMNDCNIYELNSQKRAAFRALHIGFVFQQFHLIPYLSVRDNICLPSLSTDIADPSARADELLEIFGLKERAPHKPQALSVGERQRAGLARALFHKPQLILADEPTGNLDPDNARIVLDHLSDFAANGGCVLMVTHDQAAAQRAHRQLSMENGKLS